MADEREGLVLADDEVCACLNETGGRQVNLYERCVRCRAFMQADATTEELRVLRAYFETLSEDRATAERYREALERRDELQKALNDPDLLHWLGSQDVLDVSPAVARAVSAIHRLRAALGDGR